MIPYRASVWLLWSLTVVLSARVEAEPRAPFGPAIVWRGDDAAAVGLCNAAQDSWTCLIGKMRASQASPEAIDFSARLKAMDNPGWAESFRAFGKVALVAALYPFRANTNGGYLLVNGSPSVVDTEHFTLSSADRRRSDYRRLMARLPQVDLIGEIAFDHREALAHGAARFIFKQTFATCHACDPAATGYLSFEFDGKGRYRGARLLRVGPATMR